MAAQESKKIDLGGDGITRYQDLSWLKNQLYKQGMYIVNEKDMCVLNAWKRLSDEHLANLAGCGDIEVEDVAEEELYRRGISV
jgi:hypothetical protein